jgi:TonB family protein
MRQSTLAIVCGLILVVILAVSWCGRTPPPQTVIPSTPSPTPTATATATAAPTTAATPTPSPTPTPQPVSPELQKAADKIAAAVLEVTVFDQTGQLLRTGTGFYISSDARFVTSLRTIEDGAHAVAKSPDGKIRNVIGVLGSSAPLDIALLKAETKTGVPFVALSKDSEPDENDVVAIVGSGATRREQTVTATTIVSQKTDDHGKLFEVSNSLPKNSAGAPVINDDGEAIGVVTSVGEQAAAIRSATAVNSMMTEIKPGTIAHWAGEEPSPTPTPAPKRLRVLYNPAPRYPGGRFSTFGSVRGSGTFRVLFGADGLVKDVRPVQSTGNFVLDQAAIEGLRQWRAEPGHEWTVLVPITFQP